MKNRSFFQSISRHYSLNIERLPFVNWFNIIATIYLNLRSFPFKQAIRMPIFVYGTPKLFSLYGSMICKGKCYPGMIKFNQTNAEAPSVSGGDSGIANWGTIIFNGRCQIYTSTKINVLQGGFLELGDCTKIMHHCNITAYSKVNIGNHTWITHRCQVLDTNFHFVADLSRKRIHSISKPIIIGDYCWICNNTTISGGSVIPNKVIVASNSLVNKDMSSIKEATIIGGIPAKVLSTRFRRIDNIELIKKIQNFFLKNPDKEYVYIPNLSDKACNTIVCKYD